MISRKALDDLIEDYRNALGKVNDAASTLEDASVLISAAGEDFTRESVRVINQVNNAYTAINTRVGSVAGGDSR